MRDKRHRSSGIIWSDAAGIHFTAEIYPETRFAHIKVVGQITPHIFKEALLNSFWNEKYDPSYALLIDLSDVEGFPAVDDRYNVGEVFRLMKTTLKGKIAILAAGRIVHTVATLVSMLASKEGLYFEVFEDMEEAKEWLGVIRY